MNYFQPQSHPVMTVSEMHVHEVRLDMGESTPVKMNFLHST